MFYHYFAIPEPFIFHVFDINNNERVDGFKKQDLESSINCALYFQHKFSDDNTNT